MQEKTLREIQLVKGKITAIFVKEKAPIVVIGFSGKKAVLTLSPGTWVIRETKKPMTTSQKILKFFGIDRQTRLISAVRVS